MNNIDGYITKDDIYRLISYFKTGLHPDRAGKPLLSPDVAKDLVESVQNMPTKYISEENLQSNPYQSTHIVSVGNKKVLAEPYILDCMNVMDEMVDTLCKIKAWMGSEDIQYFLESFVPTFQKVPYFQKTIEDILCKYKEMKL